MSFNELYIAQRRVEIPRRQPIALTKQINDIASLKQKGNLSTTFTVPHLGLNQNNLGFVGRPGNTSKMPYRFLPAYYIQNGVQIVSNGNAVITESSDKQTNVTLYWGNSDLFDRINFQLSELNTDEINHVYNLANAANLFNSTTGKAFYPFIDLNNENLNIEISDLVLNIERTPPTVTFKYLFQKISEKIGFAFSGNILQSDFFDTFCLQLTSRKPTVPNIQDRFIIANFIESGPTPAFFNFIPIVNNDNSFADAGKYTNKAGIRARFKFRIEWDSAYDIQQMEVEKQIIFEVLLNGVVIFSFAPSQGWSTPRVFDFIADMFPDDFIQMRYVFEAQVDPDKFTMGNNSKISTIDIEKELLEIGDTFNFSDNLPDITAADLLLRFAELTGTIFNTEDRQVQFIQYEDIKATKTKLKPFPVKPIKGSISSSFNPGSYAQNNVISYSEFAREDRSFAIIDNNMLIKQRDWLTIDFYLPEIINILGTQSLKVFWFEGEEQQDILPPIFNYQVRQLSSTMRFKTEAGATTTIVNGIFPSNLQITPAAIRDNFYKALFEVLNDFKMYSANFLLNESQFNEIRNYEAYYVEELMSFIYPESVNNYVPGQATKINMVKI